jgi:hypothetical protein
MRLHISNPETNKLARLLAKETGETITAAVIQALRDRLESLRRKKAARLGQGRNPRKRRGTPARASAIDHDKLL